jgi:hypothetical protein
MGGAGLLLGLALVTVGGLGGEFGQMLTGYGVLVLASAAYLLLGLSVRWLLSRRVRPASSTIGLTAERRA